MAEEVKQTEKSVRDILYVLFRHKWKIVIIFLVAIIVTAYLIKSAPDMFESKAKLLIGGGQTSAIELVTGVSGSSQINAEIELLRSRGFAESVVDLTGPDKILYVPENEKSSVYVFFDFIREIGPLKEEEEDIPVDPILLREVAIKVFSDTLSVGIVSRSNIINLSYLARVPELAQDILTKTIYIYMDKHIEMHTSAVSLQFLSEETEKLKAELEQSEKELIQFQEEMDVISITEQQSFLSGRIEDIQVAIEQTEADIYVSKAAIEVMKDDIDLRGQLRAEKIRLETLNARLEILNEQVEKPKEKLSILRENERKYIYLSRKVAVIEENYRRYLASLEKAKIAQTLENQKISNISVMQEPTHLIEPISQEKRKTLAIGLFLGIVGGIGIAFFLEYINHKMRSVEEIEKRLLIHDIIALPPVDTRKVSHDVRMKERQEKRKFNLPPKKMSKDVSVWLYTSNEVRECFEKIRNYVYNSMKSPERMGSGDTPYTLAVTSCYRGEGVSTVATGLAYMISLYERENVLLVDANLHNPDEDKVIGINRPPGLYEMSVRSRLPKPANDDVDQSFSVGDMDEHRSKIEGMEKIDKLLPSVEKLNYKLIVMDLPSISEGASAIRSAGLADGIILIIESERVRREVVVHAKEQLEKSGTSIIGVVLNKRRFYIPRWVYKKI